VQNPATVTGRDGERTSVALEVPLVLCPSVVEKLGLEPHHHGIVAPLDGHELRHAHAQLDAVAVQQAHLRGGEHFIEHATCPVTCAEYFPHFVVAVEALGQPHEALGAPVE
jgi:hypothetical protein